MINENGDHLFAFTAPKWLPGTENNDSICKELQ